MSVTWVVSAARPRACLSKRERFLVFSRTFVISAERIGIESVPGWFESVSSSSGRSTSQVVLIVYGAHGAIYIFQSAFLLVYVYLVITHKSLNPFGCKAGLLRITVFHAFKHAQLLPSYYSFQLVLTLFLRLIVWTVNNSWKTKKQGCLGTEMGLIAKRIGLLILEEKHAKRGKL